MTFPLQKWHTDSDTQREKSGLVWHGFKKLKWEVLGCHIGSASRSTCNITRNMTCFHMVNMASSESLLHAHKYFARLSLCLPQVFDSRGWSSEMQCWTLLSPHFIPDKAWAESQTDMYISELLPLTSILTLTGFLYETAMVVEGTI